MKTLIIAEKPELGRAIARALKADSKEVKGVIRKDDITITWAYGHLLRLKEPQEYDEKYKMWRKEDLPIVFDEWQLVCDGNKKDRVMQIGELINECDQIIHAGDPDDEGQFLIDEILDYHKNNKPVKRVYINDNTPALILRSLKEMKDNKDCVAAGKSAYARAVADYVAGINYTRLFSIALRKQAMSVGRVQSPTLGLIVKRDLMIDNHVKEKYYELIVNVIAENESIELKFRPGKELLEDEKLIKNKNVLETVIESLLADQLNPLKVENKEVLTRPPLPYNLAKLQAVMNTRYGYDLSRTDQITQTLRDKYQAITYNRSDSQYLKEEHFGEAKPLLSKVMDKLKIDLPLDYTIHSECFNDKFVSAHHAIIPTMSDFNINSLTEEERNVYTEIAHAYMMQFLPPVKKLQTTASIKCQSGELKSVTSVEIDAGYKQYFRNEKEEDETEEKSLDFPLNPGNYECSIDKYHIDEKETNPPRRYTQATLIKDMTSIAKYVEDKEIRAILKEKDKDKKGENGSIGTSATRSTIVETLIKRKYVEMKGKHIISTKLGKEFYELLPDEIKTADCTARWWVIQEDIKEGKATCKTLVDSVLEAFTPHLKFDYSIYATDKPSLGKCPCCGHKIVENSKGFGCVNYKNGCKFAIWKNDAFLQSIDKVPSGAMVAKLLKDHYCLVKLKDESVKVLIMNLRGMYPSFSLSELPERKQSQRSEQ